MGRIVRKTPCAQDIFLSGFRDRVGCGVGIKLGGDCVVTSDLSSRLVKC